MRPFRPPPRSPPAARTQSIRGPSRFGCPSVTPGGKNARGTGLLNLEGGPARRNLKPWLGCPLAMSFIRLDTKVPAWLHALVKHPDYLHQAGPDDTIKYDVYRPSRAGLTVANTCMSEVEAPDPARQLGTVARRGAIRFGRNFTHRGGEARRVASAAFKAPSGGADSEDLRKISSRQRRKAEPRHAGQRARLPDGALSPSRYPSSSASSSSTKSPRSRASMPALT